MLDREKSKNNIAETSFALGHEADNKLVRAINARKIVHTGNTTYTADNHLNSTKPRHRNSTNIIRYTVDTKKHETYL